MRVELACVARSNGVKPPEVVEAKYLLGCDGAHSWVRKQLGLKLQGTSRDVSWGVLDAFPVTNFRESLFMSLLLAIDGLFVVHEC